MRDKKKIHKLKMALLMAVAVMFVAYIANKLALNDKFDRTYPEITFEENLLKVSVEVTEEELLKGVTAKDGKDGDVTDSIIIESISNMLNDYQRIVTYAAFDGDNHVGKAERRIQYTDYKPIRFSMDDGINKTFLTTEEKTSVLDVLEANDCIDGDISNEIIIADQQYGGEKEDYLLYNYTFQVTNSSGEIGTITFPVKSNFKNENLQGGSITLKTGLVYTKVGKELNLGSYIKEASVGMVPVSTGDVKISSDVDIETPGVYTVTYSVRKEDKGAACDLIVVVEE